MKNRKNKLLQSVKKILIIVSIYFMQGAYSQNSINFNNLKTSNISTLIKLIKNKNLDPEIRIQSIKKLGELYKVNYLNLTQKEQEMIEALSSILITEKTPNIKIRIESCNTLQYFDFSAYAHMAIKTLKIVVNSEKNFDIASACIRALSQYPRHGVSASRALLKKFSKDLKKAKKKKVSKEDILWAKEIIHALSILRQKQAFIPLMKIIQSSYPVSVKRLAEAAIEKIHWD